MTDDKLDMAALLDMANAFRKSRILLTGLELGVFMALGEAVRGGATGLSSADLATRLGTEPRYTDRLLNALVALGLLEKEAVGSEQGAVSNGSRAGGALSDGLSAPGPTRPTGPTSLTSPTPAPAPSDGPTAGFRNSPLAAELLDAASPRFLASLLHTCSVYMTWSRLTDVVRSGRPARNLPPWAEQPEMRTKHFIGAMQQYGRQRAPEVADMLDLAGVERILDVGGGSGAFCHEFLERLPGATATLYDLPAVLPLAREYAREAGLSGRMDFVEGNYNVDPLPSGFDLVFMSAIVHINSNGQNRRLVANGAAALCPGGRLVIRDWIMSPDRTLPVAGALFALNMLVNTDVGDTYTADEVRGWMESAGLADVEILETTDRGGLVVGRKKKT